MTRRRFAPEDPPVTFAALLDYLALPADARVALFGALAEGGGAHELLLT